MKGFLNITFTDVQNIASKHGTNRLIAKALGIPLETFKNILYRNYIYKDEEFVNKFKTAVYKGKCLYKINRLSK